MSRTVAINYDLKRSSILKASAQVFADEGYDGASMNLVSKACGLSKAAIYHYYDSKDAILFAILDSHLRELKEQIISLKAEGDEEPEAFLSRIISEILIVYRGAEKEHQLLMNTNTINNLDKKHKKMIIGHQRELVAFMANAVRPIASQTFENDTALLRSTIMSLFAMLNWYSMWNAGRGLDARQEYAKLVSSLIINGIKGL